MSRRSSWRVLLFVVYCVEMGTFLLLWPWSGTWDRLWIQLPWGALRTVGLHPVTRSFLSAFGAVHLVWGAHDLDLWLAARRRRGLGEP
jgi:hypothetical protein